MDILSLIAEYGSWSWIIGGVALLAVELLVPGGILVWFGVAAIAVGVITLMQPMSWVVQWGLYGVLSIASLVAWLNYSKRHKNADTDRPFLNQRAERFVGREVVLKDAIVDGFGRVELGDTVWRVTGADMAQGSHVRIVSHDGAVLVVEPA